MAGPEIVIDMIGGNCPVQAEGTINGENFYFRARGAHWSLEIGGHDPCAKCDWSYDEPYGIWPDAGWMTEDEALFFIAKGAALFAGRRAGAAMDA